jgi:hypothetical protein
MLLLQRLTTTARTHSACELALGHDFAALSVVCDALQVDLKDKWRNLCKKGEV